MLQPKKSRKPKDVDEGEWTHAIALPLDDEEVVLSEEDLGPSGRGHSPPRRKSAGADAKDDVLDALVDEVVRETAGTDGRQRVPTGAGGSREVVAQGHTAPAIRAPDDGAATPLAPQGAGRETRALLKSLKLQQDLRMKAELAEAKKLGEQAKALSASVKRQQKVRKEIGKHLEYVRSMAEELGFDPNRPATEIPEITDPAVREVERTTIQDGLAYARVLFNEISNRWEYQVIEPQLTSTERDVFSFLRDTLVRTMDGRHGHTPAEWEEQLVANIDRAVLDHSILIDEVARQKIEYYIVRDFLGYGPVDVMMRDPMIEDISCDGPGVAVFLFHRQYESIRTNVSFEDETELDGFVIRLGQRSGKHISIAEPLLDATLPDKSRLQATLSTEVTTRGSSFTIRRFRADPLTPPDLVRIGTMSPGMGAFFWFAMEEGNSIIYAGGTASGKTTTLNAVSLFIPPEKKIVSLEDTREVNLPHENWIAGVTRSGFGGEGASGKRAGEIDMYRLLEAALRQRPEYLLVGEVRGKEALTLFQAMATGHSTYSTVHADSVRSAVYRLENEPINVPRMMLQTVDAIAVQVQVRVGDRMVRRVKEVDEIVGMDAETGDILTNRVFEWDPATDSHRYSGNSHILDEIRKKKALSAEAIEVEWDNRTRVLRWMIASGIRSIKDVADVLQAYYARPAAVLEKVAEWEATAVRSSREETGTRSAHPNDPQFNAAAPGGG